MLTQDFMLGYFRFSLRENGARLDHSDLKTPTLSPRHAERMARPANYNQGWRPTPPLKGRLVPDLLSEGLYLV